MSTIQLIHTNDALSISEYRSTEGFSKPGTDFNHEHHRNPEDTDLTTEQLIMQMEHIEATEKLSGKSFTTWPLDSLIDYIVNVHHRLAKQNAVIIYDLAQKVAYRHSETHPKLSKLVTALFLFLDDLLYHLKTEEQILFPNISLLGKTKNYAVEITYTNFGLVKDSAESMKREHMAMSAELKHFRELTNDFTPPEDACQCHRDLFTKMKKFENDLSLHINLENEVLFPQAILLDEE